jgi:ABC-type sulfate/molybdate transport systems ATPase subunit
MLATQAGPMPHWTVRENILLPIKNRQSERSSDPEERTAALIGLLGLDGLENRYPHQLSAGQQQRTVLARALGIDPGILLLDEIMSGQSEFWSAKIASILKHFAATGRMVVIVCHDPEWVAAHAHWVAHIVSDATDAVATTRFFVGFDGNTSEWQAFRKQRLVSIHDKDTHN